MADVYENINDFKKAQENIDNGLKIAAGYLKDNNYYYCYLLNKKGFLLLKSGNYTKALEFITE
jgi:tetratricopeptide (TPR) repeat protein